MSRRALFLPTRLGALAYLLLGGKGGGTRRCAKCMMCIATLQTCAIACSVLVSESKSSDIVIV